MLLKFFSFFPTLWRLENSLGIKNHPIEVPKTVLRDVEMEVTFCSEKIAIPCVLLGY